MAKHRTPQQRASAIGNLVAEEHRVNGNRLRQAADVRRAGEDLVHPEDERFDEIFDDRYTAVTAALAADDALLDASGIDAAGLDADALDDVGRFVALKVEDVRAARARLAELVVEMRSYATSRSVLARNLTESELGGHVEWALRTRDELRSADGDTDLPGAIRARIAEALARIAPLDRASADEEWLERLSLEERHELQRHIASDDFEAAESLVREIREHRHAEGTREVARMRSEVENLVAGIIREDHEEESRVGEALLLSHRAHSLDDGLFEEHHGDDPTPRLEQLSRILASLEALAER